MLKPAFRDVRSGAPPRGPARRRLPRVPDGRSALLLAGAAMAPVCLSLAGSRRVLAGLRVCAAEPGREWILAGAKSRDRLPPDGTMVEAVIRMEQRLLTFQARVLGCRWETVAGAGERPMIRLGWPASQPVQQTLSGDQEAASG
jgi:hypothetical protein